MRRAEVFAGLLIGACVVVSGCGEKEPVDAAAPYPMQIGSASASGPADSEAEGRRFAQQMVDALNAGDTGTIKGQECGDNDNGIGGQKSVDLPKVGQRVDIRLDSSEIASDDHFTGADLTGTVDGKQINAGRISIFREDAGWCLFTFYVL
jgi:hypothetical protein